MGFQDPSLNCLKINAYNNKRKKLKMQKKKTLLLSEKTQMLLETKEKNSP